MTLLSRVFLPFLLLTYIATETYLKLQHSSMCGQVGCKLAGELLKFDSLYLNYFGMAGVLLLIFLGFLSVKNNLAKNLFFIVLYAAIAFEATILVYQFIANPEPCIFCMGIFSSLLVIAFVSHIKQFFMIISIVIAISIALNTLAISQNKSYIIANGTYLIQSKSCPHCKKVKVFFAEKKIQYTPISAKEVNARAFLKFVDINSIPVLVIKDKSGIHIINGDQKIISYYQSPTSAIKAGVNIYGMSNDFLTAGSHDDGCTLTISDTTPCETDTNITK